MVVETAPVRQQREREIGQPAGSSSSCCLSNASLAERVVGALGLVMASSAAAWPMVWRHADRELIAWGSWLCLSSRSCAIALAGEDDELVVQRVAAFALRPDEPPRLPGPTAADGMMLRQVNAALDGALTSGLARAGETELLARLEAESPSSELAASRS